MGITSAFSIGDVKEQERLAVKQLKEVLKSQLLQAIEDYQHKYAELNQSIKNESSHDLNNPANGFDFFVDYQTLLTPHYFESSAYPLLKDNNAKFVEMAKQAMLEVKEELKSEYEGKILADGTLKLDTGARIHFTQTNAAVNKRSRWVTAKQFPEEKDEREQKLQITGNLLDSALGNTEYVKYIQGEKTKSSDQIEKAMNRKADNFAQASSADNLPPELKRELATRLRAAFYLRQLLNKEGPFKKLNTYQRNIMMGALEFHLQGSQSVTLIGCKSARDRTSVVLSAIEAMQKDPSAMKDWDTLDKHIVQSLQEGHGFRSMIWHTAIVKVSDVHGHFMKELPEKLQKAIKSQKIFSKVLDPFKPKSSTAHVQRLFGKPKKQSDAMRKKAQQDVTEIKPGRGNKSA